VHVASVKVGQTDRNDAAWETSQEQKSGGQKPALQLTSHQKLVAGAEIERQTDAGGVGVCPDAQVHKEEGQNGGLKLQTCSHQSLDAGAVPIQA